MRILHVIPSVAAVRGGPSQAVLELSRMLVEHGVDSDIITTNDNGPVELEVPLGIQCDYQGARVCFFQRFSPPIRCVREFSYSGPLTSWLEDNIRNYDLVHVHALFSYTSSAAMRIARRKGVPYICRPSGLLCKWSLQQSALRKRIFLALFDSKSLDAASVIEYTAEQEMDEAAHLNLKAPTTIMPYGLHAPERIDESGRIVRDRLGLPETGRIILYLSRLHHKKGADLLLSALNSLQEEDLHLILAGNGEDEYVRKLEDIAGSGWIGKRTHFVGFAEGEWKQCLLQAADLFVLPSYSESFAIAVLEALALGVPVITTDGVPLSTLIRNHELGWICEPNPANIATQIQLALASLSKMNSRNQRAISLIEENFSWPVIARRMRGLYEACLEGGPIPRYRLDNM